MQQTWTVLQHYEPGLLVSWLNQAGLCCRPDGGLRVVAWDHDRSVAVMAAEAAGEGGGAGLQLAGGAGPRLAGYGTAFPWPSTAFSLPFLGLPLPFHCLPLIFPCLSTAFRAAVEINLRGRGGAYAVVPADAFGATAALARAAAAEAVRTWGHRALPSRALESVSRPRHNLALGPRHNLALVLTFVLGADAAARGWWWRRRRPLAAAAAEGRGAAPKGADVSGGGGSGCWLRCRGCCWRGCRGRGRQWRWGRVRAVRRERVRWLCPAGETTPNRALSRTAVSPSGANRGVIGRSDAVRVQRAAPTGLLGFLCGTGRSACRTQ